MEATFDAMRDLVLANRILANEGVVDAYGHVSIRHPADPERYILARSRSPAIVTMDDLMAFTLDSEPVDRRDRPLYAERFIHGALYGARPDVGAVVHNHSYSVIPFGVTGVAIRPITHVGSVLGGAVPVWDIRDKFGDTSLLVLNDAQGRDLAACVGAGRVALMRGHGCVVAGATLREAVQTAIQLEIGARLQMAALQLGDPEFLSPGEIARASGQLFGDLSLARSWEYWVRRAGCQDM